MIGAASGCSCARKWVARRKQFLDRLVERAFGLGTPLAPQPLPRLPHAKSIPRVQLAAQLAKRQCVRVREEGSGSEAATRPPPASESLPHMGCFRSSSFVCAGSWRVTREAGRSGAKRGEAQRSRERSDLDAPATGYTVTSERAPARSWLPLWSLPRSFILALRISFCVWIRSVSPSFACSLDGRITSHPVELGRGSDHNPSCSRASGSGWRGPSC